MKNNKETNNLIRVLHIVGKMDMGGQETFIMNLYRKIDKDKIQFDFVVHSSERGYYDNEIEEMGGKIYRITSMSQNIIKHMKELYQILKKNKNYIVHRHTCSSIVAIDLLVARCAKIKKIIVHSHATQSSNHSKLNNLFRPLMNKLSTDRLACSKEAGEFLYGKKKKFSVINNAIEIKNFKFDINIRDRIRKEYNAGDKLVIGHVGRFDEVKNHKFIIELLEELTKKRKDIELWLIGDGKLRGEIEKKVKEKKLSNKVKFFRSKKQCE